MGMGTKSGDQRRDHTTRHDTTRHDAHRFCHKWRLLVDFFFSQPSCMTLSAAGAAGAEGAAGDEAGVDEGAAAARSRPPPEGEAEAEAEAEADSFFSPPPASLPSLVSLSGAGAENTDMSELSALSRLPPPPPEEEGEDAATVGATCMERKWPHTQRTVLALTHLELHCLHST